MAMVFIEVGDAYYLLLVMRASASRQIFHHLFFGGKEQQVSRQIQYLHVAVMEDLAPRVHAPPPHKTSSTMTTDGDGNTFQIIPTIDDDETATTIACGNNLTGGGPFRLIVSTFTSHWFILIASFFPLQCLWYMVSGRGV
jgi:hypothetical protein